MTDHRYEAWRNFLLILASILVAAAISSYGAIQNGIVSLAVFDKTLSVGPWAAALAALYVLYVTKNAHGILVTIFDEAYYQKTTQSRAFAFVSCLLTSAVVLSFGAVLLLEQWVQLGTTPVGRSVRLLFVPSLPTIFLIIFDVFHLFVFWPERDSGGLGSVARSLWRELLRHPFKRNAIHEYKLVWLAEGIVTVSAVCAWSVVVWILDTGTAVVTTTYVVLAFILLINSIVDYWLNFNYFFFTRPPVAAQPTPAEPAEES